MQIKNLSQKKKTIEGAKYINGNNISKQNKDNDEDNNDENNNYNEKNENDNDNNLNNNEEYDNQNTINDSKREDSHLESKYNSYNKRKSIVNGDMNDYSPYISPDQKYRSGFNNSINKNQFNLEYNGISDFSNNVNNEDYKYENNDMNQTKGGNHEIKEQNNNEDNHYMEDMHDFSYDRERESKKKRRNRSGSMDDKKYKNNNVKCQCQIF